MNLKSSIAEKGKIVNQYYSFSDGASKTFKGVKTDSIKQSEFTHFDLENGVRVSINPKNVNYFETHVQGS